MIIVKLQGGLGNQLFQYSLGMHLATIHKTSLRVDLSSYNRPKKNETKRLVVINELLIDPLIEVDYRDVKIIIGNRNFNYFCSKLGIRLSSNYLREDAAFRFNDNVFNYGSSVYLDGYWQSYKYFYEIENRIKYKFIQSHENRMEHNMIALHVRRGDYINNKVNISLPLEYYIKAIYYFKDRVGIDAIFYIFSDDINWCKYHLPDNCNYVFITDGSDIDQFNKMTTFSKFIIANSTFSWWAAWLSEALDKEVIAPENWVYGMSKKDLKDLIPPSWKIL